MKLKYQLRHYLTERGLTAAQLARKSNVPKQSLSGWLAGNSPRNIAQIKNVADALETTLDNLMFGEGSHKLDGRIPDIDSVLGDKWISGVFEIKIRRVQK